MLIRKLTERSIHASPIYTAEVFTQCFRNAYVHDLRQRLQFQLFRLGKGLFTVPYHSDKAFRSLPFCDLLFYHPLYGTKTDIRVGSVLVLVWKATQVHFNKFLNGITFESAYD